MPYIDREKRAQLDSELEYLSTLIDTGGELNYVSSRLMTMFVADRGKSYATLSLARSALQDAADEFYRRVIAPYEDQKARQNGDVYDEVLAL